MTQAENDQARQHRRETLNSIIDLLESLPDKQQQTDVIISAAAAIGVNVTPPATTETIQPRLCRASAKIHARLSPVLV